MSRSPQNGGFHRCTGGKPRPAGFAFAALVAAAVRPSRPVLSRPEPLRPWASRPGSLVCPWFAIVCLKPSLARFGTIGAPPRDESETSFSPHRDAVHTPKYR